MKFIELRRMCNARFYALDIYFEYEVKHEMQDIDVEADGSKLVLGMYANAKVVRFQPIINDNGEPALEVELNA